MWSWLPLPCGRDVASVARAETRTKQRTPFAAMTFLEGIFVCLLLDWIGVDVHVDASYIPSNHKWPPNGSSTVAATEIYLLPDQWADAVGQKVNLRGPTSYLHTVCKSTHCYEITPCVQNYISIWTKLPYLKIFTLTPTVVSATNMRY